MAGMAKMAISSTTEKYRRSESFLLTGAILARAALQPSYPFRLTRVLPAATGRLLNPDEEKS